MSFSFVVRPGPSPPPPREPPRLVAFRLRPGPATPKLSRPSAQPAEPRNRAVFRYKLRPNSGLYFNPVEQLQRSATYFFAAAFRLVFLVDDFLGADFPAGMLRSEEHTSELQSLMRISYAVFCLKKKQTQTKYTLTQ